MSKFVIEPHFRLQEWVAEEKGYFRAEGLEYEFRELIRSSEGKHHNKVNEGAFQSIEKGREADVSCACHWTVNVAASNGYAKLYADVYSVAPWNFRPGRLQGADAGRSRRRAYFGRLPVR
jgi:NitT/TauT family transport system substrate-binding protein